MSENDVLRARIALQGKPEKPRIRVKARRDWMAGREGFLANLHLCCQAYPHHHPTCPMQARLAEAEA